MSSIAAVTSASFASDVIAGSHEQPVVVDFWADWCGPCHQLSPMLERVAARFAEQVAVVKLDVDANAEIAGRYGIQGIPAVKAFVDGEVAAEFTGVQPEPQIERFFADLVPSEADRLVDSAMGSYDPEPLLRAALREDPGHADGLVALATLIADRGERDEALQLLERLPADTRAQRLRASLRLAEQRLDDGALADLRRRAAEGDHDAWLSLGRALAAQEDHEEALDALLAAVAVPQTREAARTAVLEVFDVLGATHPLVARKRREFTSALYA